MSVELCAIVKVSAPMRNTTGPISALGLKVGDKVIGCWNLPNAQWFGPGTFSGGGAVEAIVTVDDELQVIFNGLGTQDHVFILVR